MENIHRKATETINKFKSRLKKISLKENKTWELSSDVRYTLIFLQAQKELVPRELTAAAFHPRSRQISRKLTQTEASLRSQTGKILLTDGD